MNEPKFVTKNLYNKKYSDYYCIIYKKKTFKTKKEILYLERNILMYTGLMYNKDIKEALDKFFKDENGGFYFESEIIFKDFSEGYYHIFNHTEVFELPF